MSKRVGTLLVLLVSVTAVAAVMVYSDGTPITPPRNPAGAPIAPIRLMSSDAALGPTEIVLRLQALHRDGAYSQMAPLLDPDRRDATLEMLMATDAMLASNELLQRTAQRAYGTPLPQGWNLSVLGDRLGLFSAHLTIIDEETEGDVTTVTLQEGDNVPLVRARFARRGEGWVYVPDPIPANLAPEMRRLAGVLRDVGTSVQEGIRIDELSDALTYRVLPQVARVSRAANPSAGVAAIDSDD